MISVLMPSRGRPEMLRRAVESLWDKATNSANVEMVIGWDADDPLTDEAICKLSLADRGPVRSVCFLERLGYGRIDEMYNRLAAMATGEWLLLGNDDAIMETAGWDERIEGVPPGVLAADIQSAYSPGLCCFPAMHRKVYEALGYFSGRTVHVDSYITDICRPLGIMAPVEVYIQHNRPDLVDGEADSTFIEGRRHLQHHAYFDAAGDIQAQIRMDIERLRELSAVK